MNETHCQRGHAWTQANTYIRPDGGRECRKCANLRRRKLQRRRTVSMSPRTYFRLRQHCADEGIAMAAYVEHLITRELDAAGVGEAEIVETARVRYRPASGVHLWPDNDPNPVPA